MPAPVHYRDFPVRIREVEVVRRTQLSPTMVRITFGGPGAVGFQSAVADEHVKLIFPDPETGELRVPVEDPEDPDELVWPRPFPTSREYTVRAHRPDVPEFDIDFVLHDGGLASGWASSVAIGGTLHVAGPPGGYVVDPGYDFFLLAGDETALPAIARWLEELPRTARGRVVVRAADERSRQSFDAPEGFEIIWIYGGAESDEAWQQAVTTTPWPEGASVFVWLAGEATSIKPVRRWLRDEAGIGKQHSSITGYWKRGLADTHEHLDDDDDDDDEDFEDDDVEDGGNVAQAQRQAEVTSA